MPISVSKHSKIPLQLQNILVPLSIYLQARGGGRFVFGSGGVGGVVLGFSPVSRSDPPAFVDASMRGMLIGIAKLVLFLCLYWIVRRWECCFNCLAILCHNMDIYMSAWFCRIVVTSQYNIYIRPAVRRLMYMIFMYVHAQVREPVCEWCMWCGNVHLSEALCSLASSAFRCEDACYFWSRFQDDEKELPPLVSPLFSPSREYFLPLFSQYDLSYHFFCAFLSSAVYLHPMFLQWTLKLPFKYVEIF